MYVYVYVLQYMYTQRYKQIYILINISPNQGHGHEEFLQGGGSLLGSLVVVTVPGRGTKDGIKPTKHWIYSNQTGDTMVIDRGFLGKDGV